MENPVFQEGLFDLFLIIFSLYQSLKFYKIYRCYILKLNPVFNPESVVKVLKNNFLFLIFIFKGNDIIV